MASVGIVDYGMGNLLSVLHAFQILGADASICDSPDRLYGMDRLVLPGVGAFGDCMTNLEQRGFVEVLDEIALRRCRPVLGICLGMQAMARRSFEFGEHRGLRWFDADVVRLSPSDSALRVPQIGWNQVSYRNGSPLFLGLPPAPHFYFVHSYHMSCESTVCIEATCDYGGPVTAAVRCNNIFATQFHPEKSQDHGLAVLDNFLKWKP